MFKNLNPFSKKDDKNNQGVVQNTASVTAEPKKGFVAGLKDKATEKMLEKQLANVPGPQKEMLMSAIRKNPEFFQAIAKEIEAEAKTKGQMAASMMVMRKHQGELQKMMMGK